MRAGSIDQPGKRLENLGKCVAGDADAGVRDAQDQQGFRASGTGFGLQLETAARCELDGIVEQDSQHLAEAQAICLDRKR